MPRFIVSYSFTETVTGDADAIAASIRIFVRDRGFDPMDVNEWSVSRETDEAGKLTGMFTLVAQRTMREEISETTERAALRKFLYGMDLPDTIRVDCLSVCLAADQSERKEPEADPAEDDSVVRFAKPARG